MSLREGYIAKWKQYPTDEVKIRVARPSVLSPSKHLLQMYKNGEINWESYEFEYLTHLLLNEKAVDELMRILKLLKRGVNVRLLCYEKKSPCHRFILKRTIELFMYKRS